MEDILIKTKNGFKTLAVKEEPVRPTNVWPAKKEAEAEMKLESLADVNALFKKETPAAKEVATPVEAAKSLPAPLIKKPMAPAFYFDVKDEEEASRFKNEANENERRQKEQWLNLAAAQMGRLVKEKIGASANFSLEDKLRLEKIIASRLREIRTLIETKEALTRKNESGGLNLAMAAAETIIKIVEEEKRKWEKNPKEYVKTETENQKLEIRKQALPINEKLQAEKGLLDQNQSDINPEDIKNPQWQKIATALRTQQEKTTSDVIGPKGKIATPAAEIKVTAYQPPAESAFRKERRIMGPIEELLNVDLSEFRALGRSPKEAVNRLYEKISNLAKDSLEEKAKGVAAWKTSPLYRLYLAVGEESLRKGLPVEGILKTKNNMTWDEFQAIGDLNEQLNY
jgi:hypothetical protein